MFVVGNLLDALALVVEYVLQIYSWIVIARVVISWVNADPYNPIVRGIYSMTEPVLYRIRRVLPVYGGGIDFSPIVVFIGIMFLQNFLVQTLRQLALHMH
ncbi:MAG: YggT family protein [Deltaproteobacteria bacterium]|nr:YggT family protein [Deltaproteobacteria bacterium]